MIARSMADFTVSLRMGGMGNSDLYQYEMNLVPQKNLHFLSATTVLRPGYTTFRKLWPDLNKEENFFCHTKDPDIQDSKNYVDKCHFDDKFIPAGPSHKDNNPHTLLAASLVVRGDPYVPTHEVETTIKETLNNMKPFPFHHDIFKLTYSTLPS